MIPGIIVIKGNRSIRWNRPITPLISGLNQLGSISFSTRDNDFAPIVIKGRIAPSALEIEGELSQHVSAFIIASSFLDGVTEIHVRNPGETPWIDVTLSWLDRLGIK